MSGRAIRGLSRRVTLATSTPSASDSASHSAPRTRARYAAVVAALCALLGLGGCGGGGTSSSAPAYEVQARVVAGLGKIITDGKGFTLYVYTPDHRGPSRCSGLCAKQWPPLVLPAGVRRPIAGPGVGAALLGTVRRSNGQLQETYNGWPLYLWMGDAAPGQATGQADDMGLGYVLSVSGAVDRGTPES
jgi:predicted lipoprotein with Yx(FWY)xxD motif